MNDLHRSWVHFYIIFQISKYLRNEELMAHILAPAHRSIMALSVLLHLILEKNYLRNLRSKVSLVEKNKYMFIVTQFLLKNNYFHNHTF